VQDSAEEKIWAWVEDIQKYLFSGEYDYVFMMRAEVLIQENNFDFPVWAYDRGNDITVMDQHYFADYTSVGFDLNDVLFKPSATTRRFLQELFEYRTSFHLQGDNGPYMETLLSFLGREAKEKGRSDYDRSCTQHLKLDVPDRKLKTSDNAKWRRQNEAYNKCFFDQLSLLIGVYGQRNANDIGFSPTYLQVDDKQLLPSSFRGKAALGPWANCFEVARNYWTLPPLNCFAYRWNEASETKRTGGEVKGTCPDPTFEWPNYAKYNLKY